MSVVASNGHLHLMGRRMAGIFEECRRGGARWGGRGDGGLLEMSSSRLFAFCDCTSDQARGALTISDSHGTGLGVAEKMKLLHTQCSPEPRSKRARPRSSMGPLHMWLKGQRGALPFQGPRGQNSNPAKVQGIH